MNNYISAEQIALEWLVEQVEAGMEYPMALTETARRFSHEEADLNEAYNKLPTRAQIQAAFQLMQKQGGSFASHLADAWFYADSTNQKRIETTWADMLKKYLPS